MAALMAIGSVRALRLLHATFSHYPLRERVHILGRFITCPFLRTLDAVPPNSRILDIGAGHGTFARLAIESGAREVVALEPDPRKALLPLGNPKIRVVAGFDEAIRGTFDMVVLYDVVYRIPVDAREAFFQRVARRVKPGGLLAVKDLDPEHKLKFLWNRIQETISDRVFKLTIGSGFHYETRAELEERMRRLGFVDIRAKAIDAGYLHSHILYTARKPV